MKFSELIMAEKFYVLAYGIGGNDFDQMFNE